MREGPLFHIGCVTLVVAAFTGWPIGFAIADSMYFNAGPLGGSLGVFVMVLVLGAFAQLRRDGRVPRLHALRMPSALRDPVVWAFTVVGSVGMTGFGIVDSIETNDVAVGAAAGALVGLVVGFIVGLGVHLVRRLLRRAH